MPKTISRHRVLAVLIAAVVAADWATKLQVRNRLVLMEWREVVDGWLWLTHAENPGVSFSALAELPAAVRTPLLAALALVGIAVCARLARTARDRWTAAAAALVVAGAVGNLGDRLADGAVTDFVRLAYFPFVFNVADVAITAGAIVLALRLAAERPETPEPAAG